VAATGSSEDGRRIVEGIFLVHVTCKTHFESQCQSLWTCESTKGRLLLCTRNEDVIRHLGVKQTQQPKLSGSSQRSDLWLSGQERDGAQSTAGFFIQLRSFRDVQDRHAAPAEYAEQLSRRSALSRLCPPPDEKLHAPTPPPTTKTTQHIRWATSLGELIGTNCAHKLFKPTGRGDARPEEPYEYTGGW
jgi:hypothetical protein